MKLFRVYAHPTKGLDAVKAGFSWPAFFFGFYWMLVKKLWGLAGIWFAMYFFLGLVDDLTESAQSRPDLQTLMSLVLVVFYFALWLIPGFKGNEWRTQNLDRRGYELLNAVRAEHPDAAIAQLTRERARFNLTEVPPNFAQVQLGN
jgi:hypothetical protein